LDRSNPNAFIGLILLLVLGVFVLPDRLPSLIESIPCSRRATAPAKSIAIKDCKS
jgi:hypothetical protein